MRGDHARKVEPSEPAPGESPISSVTAISAEVNARHNLPSPLTSFVGREAEIAEIKQRLGRTRLLTLVGPGGVGKTRLASRVGLDLAPRYQAGAWMVTLAPLDAHDLILRAAAVTLGVYEEPSRDLLETIVEALRARGPLLLILDNCEHLVIGVADTVACLLRGCPELTILATSRSAFGVDGETIHRVPSLSLPDDVMSPQSGAAALATLMTHEATRLFVERARAVHDDLVVTPESAQLITQICRRLDGIPLAIELAAARTRVLTPQQIATRLDDRFRLLTDGSRTADPRQRTLRATIDWSYALLTSSEQAVLHRVAVFAGGCTLEAIEAICDDTSGSDDTLDLVMRLADRSLLVVDLSGSEARYGLLETIRAYALERLEASGEAERVRRRHAEYFLMFAEQAGPRVRFTDGRHWLDRLEEEQDNLRAALAWGAEAPGDPNLMPRIAGALWWYWFVRGPFTEGREWLERALRIVVEPAERLTLLYGASVLAFNQDDYPVAGALAAEGVRLGRAQGDQQAVAWALARVGYIARRVGDFREAVTACEEALALSRQIGDSETTAHALLCYGQVLRGMGDFGRAEVLLAECGRLAHAIGQTIFESLSLDLLAYVALVRGDLDRAEALCDQALVLVRRRADRWTSIPLLEIRVRIAQHRGDAGQVVALARDIASGFQAVGNRAGLATAASVLAWVAHVRGDNLLAARMFGASDAVIEAAGRLRAADEQQAHDADVALVRTALGDEAYAAAWAEGRVMTFEQAVEYTIQAAASDHSPPSAASPSVRRSEPPAQPSTQDYPLLTPRETDVVRLITRGLTNRQIADELVISERTASSHVYRLLGKLGFSSRAQIAAWAATHGFGTAGN